MKKILVADHDLKLVAQLEKVLSEQGFLVFHSRDTSDLLEKAIQIKPDLLILDTMFPGPNNGKSYEFLQQSKDTADIPTIYMTGTPSLAFDSGVYYPTANGFLRKPFNTDMLLKEINRTMGRSSSSIYELVNDPSAFFRIGLS